MLSSFLGWVFRTVMTAAEAEMNDDTTLREQLLEAEMRREMGELSDEEFAELESDLLARIREIKERREGGSGPLAFGSPEPLETSPDSRFQIEASVSGDFHEPADAPHTTIVESEPGFGEAISVLDIEPGQAEEAPASGLPLTAAGGPNPPGAGSAQTRRSPRQPATPRSRRRHSAPGDQRTPAVRQRSTPARARTAGETPARSSSGKLRKS